MAASKEVTVRGQKSWRTLLDKKAQASSNKQVDIFARRRRTTLISMILLVVACVVIADVSDFNYSYLITKIDNIPKFVSVYFPPSFIDVPRILRELGMTVIISIGATTIAAGISIVLAILACDAMELPAIIKYISLGISTVLRNIPIYVWQIILGIIFWTGGFFLAFLIILLLSMGFLIRSFAETMNEISSDGVEALSATGATKIQVITNVIIPETLPSLVSWTLFCAETNIRSSALIGYLTGSGIGFLVSHYRGFVRDLPATMGVIIVICITIIAYDAASNKLREKIMNG